MPKMAILMLIASRLNAHFRFPGVHLGTDVRHTCQLNLNFLPLARQRHIALPIRFICMQSRLRPSTHCSAENKERKFFYDSSICCAVGVAGDVGGAGLGNPHKLHIPDRRHFEYIFMIFDIMNYETSLAVSSRRMEHSCDFYMRRARASHPFPNYEST